MRRQLVSTMYSNSQKNTIVNFSLRKKFCLLAWSYSRSVHQRTPLSLQLLLAPCKGIRNAGKFCLWNPESWTLESVIPLKESGILLTIGIGQPRSTDKESGFWCLESGIHSVESRIQDCLGLPYIVRYFFFVLFCFFTILYIIFINKGKITKIVEN